MNVNPPPLLLCSPPHFSFFSSLVPTPSAGCPLPLVGPQAPARPIISRSRRGSRPAPRQLRLEKCRITESVLKPLLATIKVTPPRSRIGTPTRHLCHFRGQLCTCAVQESLQLTSPIPPSGLQQPSLLPLAARSHILIGLLPPVTSRPSQRRPTEMCLSWDPENGFAENGIC